MRGRGDGETNGEGESDRHEAKRRAKSGWKKRKKQWKLMRGKGENRRRQEMVDSKIETTNFQ